MRVDEGEYKCGGEYGCGGEGVCVWWGDEHHSPHDKVSLSTNCMSFRNGARPSFRTTSP
jgi:hypothetical protein